MCLVCNILLTLKYVSEVLGDQDAPDEERAHLVSLAV
jgi:hypothetical protein